MNPAAAEIMRSTARQEYETKYTAAVNYEQLMAIYDSTSQP
jgi:hypothetical protein